MKFGKILPLALGFLPVMTLAARDNDFSSVQSGLQTVMAIINDYLVPLVIALAVIFFLFGVFKYVRSAGDEGARTEGRNMMIYGIIGIFVMVSVWGLVNVLQNTFNLGSGTIDLPTTPDQNTGSISY